MGAGRKPPGPRVLILGGGFAGIGAARKLKDADVEVLVVDKHDYHTFQPMLQVATDLLPAETVAHPDVGRVHPRASQPHHRGARGRRRVMTRQRMEVGS
jgi:NADH dehydrogenase FAD-containing subunit